MPNLIKMSVSIVILFGSQVLGNKERKKTKQNKTTILPSKEFQFGPLYPFSIYLFFSFIECCRVVFALREAKLIRRWGVCTVD
jgi:hypothetical protein